MSSWPLVEEHATGLFVPIPKSEKKNQGSALSTWVEHWRVAAHQLDDWELHEKWNT